MSPLQGSLDGYNGDSAGNPTCRTRWQAPSLPRSAVAEGCSPTAARHFRLKLSKVDSCRAEVIVLHSRHRPAEVVTTETRHDEPVGRTVRERAERPRGRLLAARPVARGVVAAAGVLAHACQRGDRRPAGAGLARSGGAARVLRRTPRRDLVHASEPGRAAVCRPRSHQHRGGGVVARPAGAGAAWRGDRRAARAGAGAVAHPGVDARGAGRLQAEGARRAGDRHGRAGSGGLRAPASWSSRR